MELYKDNGETSNQVRVIDPVERSVSPSSDKRLQQFFDSVNPSEVSKVTDANEEPLNEKSRDSNRSLPGKHLGGTVQPASDKNLVEFLNSVKGNIPQTEKGRLIDVIREINPGHQTSLLSSVDGVPTIGRTAEAIPGGSLSARDDTTNICHFVRPVNPSEVSKATNANGEPLVVFHGGPKGIEVFNVPYVGTWFSSGQIIPDIRRKDGGEIYPVFLSIKNPKVFSSTQQSDAYFDGLVEEAVRFISAENYKKHLESLGYDEIMLKETRADYGITDTHYIWCLYTSKPIFSTASLTEKQ